MNPEIAHRDPAPQRHTEGLNRTIQILVIDRVLVMPNSSTWIRNFVADKPDAVISRIRLNLIHCRAGPSFNSRLLSHGGSCATKTKGLVDSGYAVSTIRRIVVHVALAGMTLAPRVFVRDDVLRFGKICRSRVQRRVQVVNVNEDSMRRYVMTVAGVIVRY